MLHVFTLLFNVLKSLLPVNSVILCLCYMTLHGAISVCLYVSVLLGPGNRLMLCMHFRAFDYRALRVL